MNADTLFKAAQDYDLQKVVDNYIRCGGDVDTKDEVSWTKK